MDFCEKCEEQIITLPCPIQYSLVQKLLHTLMNSTENMTIKERKQKPWNKFLSIQNITHYLRYGGNVLLQGSTSER
jgi:hypothetical protein